MNLKTLNKTTLNKGDLLYIPRGVPHKAVNKGKQTAVHLTLAVAVENWQTVEAAMHLALIIAYSRENVFPILREKVKVVRSFSVPVRILLHTAVRNFANGLNASEDFRVAESGFNWRRAMVYAGQGDFQLFENALAALCVAKPAAVDIVSSMHNWENPEENKFNGRGSVSEFVADLNQFPGTSDSAWDGIRKMHVRLEDAETFLRDRKKAALQTERTLTRAWESFCGVTASDHWPDAIAWMLRNRALKRKETLEKLRINSQLHGWDVDFLGSLASDLPVQKTTASRARDESNEL